VKRWLSLSNLRLRDELRQRHSNPAACSTAVTWTLPRELNRAQRLNSPLCVVMLDIDGFKQFNDSFGHGPGDSLLCEFAGVLREHLRKSDISCRYGGDEFVLVMPDSSIMDTQQRVEQIRVLLEELQHIQGGQQSLETITLSAGIAYMPDHGTTEIDLMKAADEAMYRAKQEGRNRVVVYQKPSQSMEMAAALG
jgi:diguanylate cyclase (GGDEF)-like protein